LCMDPREIDGREVDKMEGVERADKQGTLLGVPEGHQKELRTIMSK